MAVADVYDALISRRVYKPAFTHERAVELIAEGRGKHFDPDITDAFMEIREEFRTIALKFGDSDSDIARQAERLAEAQA
jgi:putative two-component system response regulator